MNQIEAIEQLHRAAQARLGIAVRLLSADYWQTVQATTPIASGRRWMTLTAEAIMAARELSALLARSYYQLARATEVGVTLGDVLGGRQKTLGGLRDAFLEQAMAVATLGSDGEKTPLHALITPDVGGKALEQVDILPSVQKFLDAIDEDEDGRSIRVESFEWPRVQSGDQMLASVRKSLTEKAINPLATEVNRKTRGETDGKKTLRSVDAAYEAKGQLGAGKADNLAISQGRELISYAIGKDRMVIKFARGLGPNPCYWCAMLASRGFVYNSRQSAGSTMRDGGMRAWHDNCHCYPIARWVKESPLPPLNEFFEKNWEPVTRRVSGKEKLRVWRTWVAEQRRDGKLPQP